MLNAERGTRMWEQGGHVGFHGDTHPTVPRSAFRVPRLPFVHWSTALS
jgi:hypothetical protein